MILVQTWRFPFQIPLHVINLMQKIVKLTKLNFCNQLHLLDKAFATETTFVLLSIRVYLFMPFQRANSRKFFAAEFAGQPFEQEPMN